MPLLSSLQQITSDRGQWLLVATTILSLALGIALNETLLPGQYEWTGLLRICADLFRQDGFWLMALLIWAVGVSNAIDGFRWACLSQRCVAGSTWLLGTLALFHVANANVLPLPIGSAADQVAFAFLIPGMLVVDVVRQRGQSAAIVIIARSTATGIGVFAGYTVISYCHTMLKGVLFVLATPLDAWLAGVEASLFGEGHLAGLAEWRKTHPSLVAWLDITYIGLLQQICWSALFFHGARNSNAGKRYLLAVYLIYSLGSLSYFLLPSMGPIFHSPMQFADLQSFAEATWHLSRYLTSNTSNALAGSMGEIAPYGFIAAFPSIHVGVAAIMLFSMRTSRFMTAFNLGLLMLTSAATYILGWHYLADIGAGILLGAATWWLTLRLLEDSPQEPDAPTT